MRIVAVCVVVLLLIASAFACGPAKSYEDCAAIEQHIRARAADAGIPSSGICSATNPQIQSEFGAECQSYKECLDHCCK